jgi:hypothetical protein
MQRRSPGLARESKRLQESQEFPLLVLGQIPESLSHVFRLALMSLDGDRQMRSDMVHPP